MTENHTLDNDPEILVDFDDDALDEWIAGGEITKHAVIMYGKPQLAAEFELVEDDLARARARSQDGEDDLSGGEVGALLDRQQEIYDEWEASRSRWVVRALSDQLVDEADQATVAAVGTEPIPPNEPAKGSPKSKHDEYADKLAQHEKAQRTWQDRQNAEIIMRLVERIEFADGRVGRVKAAEQVLRMRAKYGEHQMMKILEAARRGQLLSPELKAPFSSRTSPDEQT